MAIIFFDGFDYYTGFGPGGRKWDQASGANISPGRFGGQCMNAVAVHKTFASDYASLIVGFATNVSGFQSGLTGTYQPPTKPFFAVYDGTTPQFSLWYNPTTWQLEIRTGFGTLIGDTIEYQTPFIPPLTLWFYLEISFTIGSGTFDIHVDGTSVGSGTGIALQQTGNATVNRIHFNQTNDSVGGIDWGQQSYDDLYVINPSDSSGAIDFLGEVRVQTKYPDADGFQDDFLRSAGSVNANNVNTSPVTYTNTTNFNYSGTVGAKDLYSIANFTISGTIFAVQENLSFRKDDVGNRNVTAILRTASTNYEGTIPESTITHDQEMDLSFSCFSSYTYGGQIWEKNPSTADTWDLIDLNLTEFGIKVVN